MNELLDLLEGNFLLAALMDALVSRGLVAEVDRVVVAELLGRHVEIRMVIQVTCSCGSVVQDFVAHRAECLLSSGFLRSAG